MVMQRMEAAHNDYGIDFVYLERFLVHKRLELIFTLAEQ